jgi:hypothetical protein
VSGHGFSRPVSGESNVGFSPRAIRKNHLV